MTQPLEQFAIKPWVTVQVGVLDLSFSNSAASMMVVTALLTGLMTLAVRPGLATPNRWQSLVELSYGFVANLVRSNAGQEGMKYFPFVFSIFSFILLGNLLGMIPHNFTFTSHIIVTFALAITVFTVVTMIGLLRHGWHFFSLFFPPGAPVFMAPLLVPIEILSYLTRPVSLSIRLFANMMAGHTMLAVFAGFSVSLGIIGGLAPFVLIVALIGFEVLVAVLQAYVFTVLTCLYLHDAIELH